VLSGSSSSFAHEEGLFRGATDSLLLARFGAGDAFHSFHREIFEQSFFFFGTAWCIYVRADVAG
jgi:hypothetical protein